MTAAARPGKRRPKLVIHRRKLAPPLPPMHAPLDAVLITLDSARRTGYATCVLGRLWDFGEVDARKPADRMRVLNDALGQAYMRAIPCALLIEVPWGGYQATAISLAQTAALWRDSWAQLGQMSERCIERTAGDWRRLLFGRSNLPRDYVRKLEAALAAQTVALEAPHLHGRPIGGDSAAAISISRTIVRSRELRTLLACECVDYERVR